MKKPQYPVYVISKGRADTCLTARFLIEDGVPFSLVIEPQEEEQYQKYYADKIVALPFSNLGQGSIPARNWVWEDALKKGYERHWILDDNISCICRRYKGRKIRCAAGVALAAAEDFIDRYENVGVAGLNYYMFVPNREKVAPFFLNVHVYSCLLIRNDLPYRWRGRYNEDTDLCLQVLSGGWCTVLFNAFIILKTVTMKMKGGNTDELYKADGRLKMARSLERLWPGVVSVDRRFRRPQHVIKDAWRRFDTPLKRKKDIQIDSKTDEYGMELVQIKEIKSKTIRRLMKDKLSG
jgi:hypothetical protein